MKEEVIIIAAVVVTTPTILAGLALFTATGMGY